MNTNAHDPMTCPCCHQLGTENQRLRNELEKLRHQLELAETVCRSCQKLDMGGCEQQFFDEEAIKAWRNEQIEQN